MIETLRSYMQLAAGLLESASERAKDSAADLINQGMEAGTQGPETVSAQVQGIAEDLIEQGRTNRELMIGLVRTAGTTLIAVSHGPGLLDRMDRVITLRDGRLTNLREAA